MQKMPTLWLYILLIGCVVPSQAQADPCGMVPPPPPPYLKKTTLIERIGAQKTYVFYKNGIESIVLRPGFKGKVSQFGMLIPFPSIPAIRKVPNETFSHIASAIDPPEVVIRVRRRRRRFFGRLSRSVRPQAMKSASTKDSSSLGIHQVRVVRQEAVGMYQVAVLQAGSPQALERWMKRNQFRYPKGMNKVIHEYIRAGWCFVAVKARVAGKKGLSPYPGMRSTRAHFPQGGTFTGKVQAMGFRFRSRRLVVPMRLSAFNKGKLRNIVYLLTRRPKRIKRIPRKFVVRQVKGKHIYRNLTEPLPLRVIGGSRSLIPRWRWNQLHRMRNPIPHNGHATSLFASDLLAARKGKLVLPHEEEKKMLLRIEERLRLRGSRIDALNRALLKENEKIRSKTSLYALRNMTLTVVDGDFPREIIAAENLTFTNYRMSHRCNGSEYYHARTLKQSTCASKKPSRVVGNIFRGKGPGWKAYTQKTRKVRKHRTYRKRGGRYFYRLIRQFSNPKRVERALARIIRSGSSALPYLIGESLEGIRWVRRGWSIVALSELGGAKAKQAFLRIQSNSQEERLVRYWAMAAGIRTTQEPLQLTRYANLSRSWPALRRPLRIRLQELLTREKKGAALRILKYAASHHQFRNILQKSLRSLPLDPLLEAGFNGKTNRIRRLATSYISVHIQKRPIHTFKRLMHYIRYRPGARSVPWQGGALYLPNLPTPRMPRFNTWTWRSRAQNIIRRTPWEQMEAQIRAIKKQRDAAFVRWQKQTEAKRKAIPWLRKHIVSFVNQLLMWSIWAENRGQSKEVRKIALNINQWNLRRYTSFVIGLRPFILQEVLHKWGKRYGRNNLQRLLKQAGVAHRSKYRIDRLHKAKQDYYQKLIRSYGPSYKGCFRRLMYRRYRYIGSYHKQSYCQKRCKQYGKKYTAYALNRSACYCLQPQGAQHKLSESFCNLPCYREPKRMCGGHSSFSVYNLH